ncbi:galactose-1-epimerase [Vibrio sp. 10N.286.49.C2]|uniref:galactose-1-epimerase n=1 Tax=unclassified Vibrio TaxID=2614977 RepID=UPI000C82E67C|nr:MULTISPECIES: galactose-1-epimerase [unclassified Vibrio]PMH29617.1 galactose-1-epimerase [Vibrio sp. 10N.286.49.C2]PMH56133.1 galactose-1-epimerase [Vibrio sp. 10N.286.49.B1]PMH82296.1 galactose-1-epimerase [Vibrio sp. 10N.286.48.B7]
MSISMVDTLTAMQVPDGNPVELIELSNVNGMVIGVLDVGATWVSCKVPLDGEPDGCREVLLGCLDYTKQVSYMGATVGRYANRIKAGQFSIEADTYQLALNQAGNTLHGGSDGFDKRRWQVLAQGVSFVELKLCSADGDQGFPGNLTVITRYDLTDDNEVVISYRATTDSPTVVNLTNHAYFNLLGAESGQDCLGHRLMVNADQFLPSDEKGIPLGELQSVVGTSFDFNESKRIDTHWMQDEHQQRAKGYDHSFLLNHDGLDDRPVAYVHSPDGALTLQVFSNKPAMQLYTGNYLAGTPNRSKGCYTDYAGFALETQFLPDSPNHPEWPQPSCILQPDQEYWYTTSYRFDISGEES